MYRSLLISALVLHTVAASENKLKYGESEKINKSNGLSFGARNNVASHHNITYIDKSVNMLRTPNINTYYEEHKKTKKPKKVPKRTIQKIIKKNRAKLRKVYSRFNQKAKQTTASWRGASSKIDYEKLYGQEEKQWKDEQTTTQVNHRKKSRKYSPKVSGYHIPFQRHQRKDKRYKRGLSRELYILKDLDEIEFLSKEDGDDVVKTHVKNFW